MCKIEQNHGVIIRNNLLALSIFFLLQLSLAASSKSPAELYPNRLITQDYGIVTADDLAYDNKQMFPAPYDPSKNLFNRYWQCIPVKAVMPKYDTWLGEDGMGPAGVEIPMCELETQIKLSSGLQIYGDRRAHPDTFCREFDRNWRKLTRGEEIVCFNGEAPSNENDKALGKYRSWVWNKFKTRKGCYSYFGDCDVKGCAKEKCKALDPMNQ